MKLFTVILSIALMIALLLSSMPALLAEPLDFDIPYGHFFKQTSGMGGTGDLGFAVVDDTAPFWSEFQRLGGIEALGYPISRRFEWDGFVAQAFQKAIFQWRPEGGQGYFVNVFDRLSAAGKDSWLEAVRATPPAFDHSADQGLSWDEVVKRHLTLLDQSPAIRSRYLADSDPILHFGLPMSYKDYGNVYVVRAQRAVFQQWKVDVAWAKAGEVVVANGGDVAKEARILPLGAGTPVMTNRSFIVSVVAGPGRLYLAQKLWEDQSIPGASNVTGARLLVSDDLGNTWTPFSGGLPVGGSCLNSVSMDYATRDALYVGTCQGIYRWTGTSWENISSRQVDQISVAYGNPKILRSTEEPENLRGTGARFMIESLDGGKSWSNLEFPGAAGQLGIGPRNLRQTYALSVFKGWWFSLYRSAGGPGQWTALNTPSGSPTAIHASMTIDGATGDIYLMARAYPPDIDQLWRSPNPSAPDANTVRWEFVHDFGNAVNVVLLASAGGPNGLALYGTLGYRPGGGLGGSWLPDDPMLIRALDGGRTWEGLVIQ